MGAQKTAAIVLFYRRLALPLHIEGKLQRLCTHVFTTRTYENERLFDTTHRGAWLARGAAAGGGMGQYGAG